MYDPWYVGLVATNCLPKQGWAYNNSATNHNYDYNSVFVCPDAVRTGAAMPTGSHFDNRYIARPSWVLTAPVGAATWAVCCTYAVNGDNNGGDRTPPACAGPLHGRTMHVLWKQLSSKS